MNAERQLRAELGQPGPKGPKGQKAGSAQCRPKFAACGRQPPPSASSRRWAGMPLLAY